MVEAAEAALGFVTGRSRGDLDTDAMLLFALVRAVEIFGEAAGRVSQDTRDRARSVPWPQIVATRNRLIHAYFDIDRDILWKTVTEEIPALLPRLRDIV
jgi:uncharacterized protein with HEPN domain